MAAFCVEKQMSKPNILINVLVCLLLCIACSPNDQDRIDLLFENGNNHFDNGKYQEALRNWNQALQLDPDSPPVRFQMAVAYQKLGEFDLSSKIFRQVIGGSYRTVDAYLMIAENEIMSGRLEKALKICSDLKASGSDLYKLKMTAGHIETLMGHYRKGESLYREAIAIDGDRPEAYFILAANLMAQHQLKLADAIYAKAMNLKATPTIAFWLNQGEYLNLKGEIEKARSAFKRALEQEPTNVNIQLKIAQSYIASKQYRELSDFFGGDQARQTQHPTIQKLVVEALLNDNQMAQADAILESHRLSEQSDWLLLNGKYHLLSGNLTLGISCLESSLKMSADDPIAYHLLALAYLAANKINLASQTWIRLLTLFPEGTDAELGIADLYYKRGHYDLSIKYLKRVVSKVPESYRAYIMLGNCWLALGRCDEAGKNYLKALAINPNSLPALNYLAVAKEKAGNVDEAVRLYEMVMEKNPELADVGLRLARLMTGGGRKDQSIAVFTALADSHPENGYVNFILGEIYHAHQEFEKARQEYTTALQKNPNLLQAYRKIAELETDPEKKIGIISTAIEKAPKSIELQMLLAGYHYTCNDLQSAVAVLEDLHAKHPKNALIANNLAWLYLERDQASPSAYELARYAYEAEPVNPNYAHTLGWACYHKGLLNDAEWHLRESMGLLARETVHDESWTLRKAVFGYHLARLLYRTEKADEAGTLLSAAIDGGLPDRYRQHARDLLDGTVKEDSP